MQVESIHSSLYDTLSFYGDGKYDMFSTPEGLKGKTFYDTNMLLSNMLPEHNTFLYQKLLIKCPVPATFKFIVGRKDYAYYKLFSNLEIPILPILIVSLQNFGWSVDLRSNYDGIIFITMLGVLTRPVA